MNKKLIKLYFQIEKEIDNCSGKESKQIETFIVRLIEENKKITPSDHLRNDMFAKFKDERLMPLLEESFVKKDVENGIKQECFQLALKILGEILGKDLDRAKRIKEKLQLKNIVESCAK